MGIFIHGNPVNYMIPANFHINGNIPEVLFVNGVKAWEQVQPTDSETFTASGTFTVPLGTYEVTICMCAGAGAGAKWSDNPESAGYLGSGGGGQAGQIISQIVEVTPSQEVTVTIGRGGYGSTVTQSPGEDGFDSSFGAVVASGGSGGTISSGTAVYAGNGGTSESCGGTFSHGTATLNFAVASGTTVHLFGGEAGMFGSGGVGRNGVMNGGDGGVGAGGGCGQYPSSAAGRGGHGGNGRCVVTWQI